MLLEKFKLSKGNKDLAVVFARKLGVDSFNALFEKLVDQSILMAHLTGVNPVLSQSFDERYGNYKCVFELGSGDRYCFSTQQDGNIKGHILTIREHPWEPGKQLEVVKGGYLELSTVGPGASRELFDEYYKGLRTRFQ